MNVNTCPTPPHPTPPMCTKTHGQIKTVLQLIILRWCSETTWNWPHPVPSAAVRNSPPIPPSARHCFQSQVDGPRGQFQATHPAGAAHAAMFLWSSVQMPVAPEDKQLQMLLDQNISKSSKSNNVKYMLNVQRSKQRTWEATWGEVWSQDFWISMSYQVTNVEVPGLPSESARLRTKPPESNHHLTLLSIWQSSKPTMSFH